MSSSCRPPANSTYLTIGQDLFSIDEYVNSQYNYSLHHHHPSSSSSSSSNYSNNNDTMIKSISDFVPSAFMVYTDLKTLGGLWDPIDYGTGIEYADGIMGIFPSSSSSSSSSSNNNRRSSSPAGLQIGLWLDGADGCFSICAGEMDDNILLLASYLERSRASRIFLRLGYEFDNPAFEYDNSPDVYVLAFRKIVIDIRKNLSEEARDRVLFVWHSWAAPMSSEDLSLERFYPGDDVVDWIGVSIFQQVFPWSSYWAGKMSDVENVLDFARDRDKPTMIAESTPFGGIELKQASVDTKKYLAINDYDDDDWERWFGKVISLIDRYDVSMWCYINCDWESQPMWHGVGFGETRLSSNARVMSQWYDKITNNGLADRKFLFAGSLEYCDGLELADEERIRDVRFISYILVPFLLAAGAFFIPYYILGKHKVKSTKEERRPLLSNIDEIDRTSARFRDVKKTPAAVAP